jgi:hypothetical protein
MDVDPAAPNPDGQGERVGEQLNIRQEGSY